ncbi:MAG: hypothetical protein NW226_20415 [Microscillaceae bacterium]|nr:hypothetical protein [Microscillaceae bacterium]
MQEDYEGLAIKIEYFWDWFLSREYEFRNITDPYEVKEALDNQILSFGLFTWEIGINEQQKHYLLISPNSNAERLKISKMIVEAAPPLSQWDFYDCKPPHAHWDFKIKLYDAFMILQEIDTSRWEFVWIPEEEKRLKIFLKLPELRNFEEDDLAVAAEVALTHILGEEFKINHLAALTIVSEWNPSQKIAAKPLKELKKRIEIFWDTSLY